MSALRLSSRYAKSLTSLAKEKNVIDEIFADMKVLRDVLDKNRDFLLMLKSPIVHSDAKLTVVRKIFEGKIHDITFKFINIIIRKGREGYLKEIVDSFFERYNEMNNISPVRLVTPIELDDSQKERIKEFIKKDSSVGKIQLKTVVDPSIIGGYIIQYEDKLIDSSVSSRLKTIRRNIEDSSYKVKF
ncbi:MAG: F0F1 ATP synthase subunit delta [Chitinophagales bacterium]|nr:F0F1 ATP synthase subunit delta [Chitinophagales bacterium]